MSAMASQITSLTIVYSIVYSGADQIKHQSSASLAFVSGIHRWPVNSPHKGSVMRKMFPFDDHVYHLPDRITYIASHWLAFQANLIIPKELKQVTTTAVWFSAGVSDIRKFHPWFDLQPKFHYWNHNFLNTFREILSHHIWYFPRSLSQWIHL